MRQLSTAEAKVFSTPGTNAAHLLYSAPDAVADLIAAAAVQRYVPDRVSQAVHDQGASTPVFVIGHNRERQARLIAVYNTTTKATYPDTHERTLMHDFFLAAKRLREQELNGMSEAWGLLIGGGVFVATTMLLSTVCYLNYAAVTGYLRDEPTSFAVFATVTLCTIAVFCLRRVPRLFTAQRRKNTWKNDEYADAIDAALDAAKKPDEEAPAETTA